MRSDTALYGQPHSRTPGLRALTGAPLVEPDAGGADAGGFLVAPGLEIGEHAVDRVEFSQSAATFAIGSAGRARARSVSRDMSAIGGA